MSGRRADSLSTLPRETVEDDDAEVEEVRSHEGETDDDSLSRAPTLPFGVAGGPVGGGVGHVPLGPTSEELLRASGRPLQNPNSITSLPPGEFPPRGPIGSERLRAASAADDLLAHAARAKAVLAQAEESPLNSADTEADKGAASAALAAAMEVDARSKLPPPPGGQHVMGNCTLRPPSLQV